MWDIMNHQRSSAQRLVELHQNWHENFYRFKARQFLVLRRLWRHTKPRTKRYFYHNEQRQFMTQLDLNRSKESVSLF